MILEANAVFLRGWIVRHNLSGSTALQQRAGALLFLLEEQNVPAHGAGGIGMREHGKNFIVWISSRFVVHIEVASSKVLFMGLVAELNGEASGPYEWGH